MTFVVLTKWINKAVSFGTAKHPACVISGVTNYTDITGQLGGNISTGKYLLCMVICDQTTANTIESGNLGVVLWQSGDGPLTTALVTTIKAKLTAYGVPAAALNKIAANTSLATIQAQIRTILQGQ